MGGKRGDQLKSMRRSSLVFMSFAMSLTISLGLTPILAGFSAGFYGRWAQGFLLGFSFVRPFPCL